MLRPMPQSKAQVWTTPVLTEALAVEIYKYKLALKSLSSSAAIKIKAKSLAVSQRFGVSPKTVRDIWRRRTWIYATYPLWSDEETHPP